MYKKTICSLYCRILYVFIDVFHVFHISSGLGGDLGPDGLPGYGLDGLPGITGQPGPIGNAQMQTHTHTHLHRQVEHCTVYQLHWFNIER